MKIAKKKKPHRARSSAKKTKFRGEAADTPLGYCWGTAAVLLRYCCGTAAVLLRAICGVGGASGAAATASVQENWKKVQNTWKK